jgi:hypothetical protein
MIEKGSAELQGMLKAAVYRSGRRRRQWAKQGGICCFFSHCSKQSPSHLTN